MQKKWRTLTFSWNLFFLLSYGITLVTCFICNLAVNKTLSWFWVVLFSLVLSASFTNLPRYIKKFKLLLLSFFPLISLITLLGVCCIYTGGNWFLVATIPTFLAFVMVFLPIYIKTYNFPTILQKHRWIFCVIINYLILIGMFYVIENFCLANNHSYTKWATKIALPISSCCLVVALFIVCILRYLKINRWFKTSFVILTFAVIWLPLKILLNYLGIDKKSTYMLDFSNWKTPYIDNNISFIIIVSLLLASIIFNIIGILKHKKRKA